MRPKQYIGKLSYSSQKECNEMIAQNEENGRKIYKMVCDEYGTGQPIVRRFVSYLRRNEEIKQLLKTM